MKRRLLEKVFRADAIPRTDRRETLLPDSRQIILPREILPRITIILTDPNDINSIL
jgi:hypothetical protein